jgi:hypothetical protein
MTAATTLTRPPLPADHPPAGPRVIGVDLDGVCYPFVPVLRAHVMAHTGRPFVTLPDPTAFDFAAQWSMTTAELLGWMRHAVSEGALFAAGDPYPGVVSGLRRLAAAGHRIHVVTDRPDGPARDRTRAWLRRHQVTFHDLTFTADKTGVGADVFIEDKPSNYAALVAAGVDTYLRSHPYNAHVRTPPGRRVASFTAFTARVLAATARS